MKNLLLILSILFYQGAFAQWYEVNSSTTENLHDIFFVDSLAGYCVGGGTPAGTPLGNGVILETMDGGENWATVFSQDSLAIEYVAVITENDTMKVLSFARQNNQSYLIWSSMPQDNESWVVIPIDYRPVNLRVYNNEIYFIDALDDYSLKKKTSSQIELIHSEISFIHISDYGIIAFELNGIDIIKSHDLGTTWSDVPSPAFATHRSTLAMFNDTIIFTNYYGPATFFSYNAGESWDYFEGGAAANTVIVSPKILFTTWGNDGNVSYTNNTGESWEFMGNYNVSKFYFKDDLGFMVGPEGSIYKLDNVGALGINEPLKTNMNIYPNPASNYVTLAFDEVVAISSIELMDTQGKVAKTYSKTESQLNLAGIASGAYILKVETDMGLASKRIVIP